MTWVFLAIIAAAFQTLRFLLQKKLSLGRVSAAGATYARFLYAAPLVVVASAIYLTLTGTPMPQIGGGFWPWVLLGGLAQILGTWAVVALFAQRHFAVGITFKKTEVLQTALVGFVLLGDRISAPGMAAITLGLVGVAVLSARQGERFSLKNKAAGLGLLSGALFAVSAVAYRGAVLEIATDSAALRAMLTLSAVTISQTLAMTLWLWFYQRDQIGLTLGAWRPGLVIGLAGTGGSLGWFAAFSLQNAAYVFAVGQIEVIFSILAGRIFFGERLSAREALGIGLVTLSILALIFIS